VPRMDDAEDSDAFWALALAAEEETLRAHAATSNGAKPAAAPPAAPPAATATTPPRPAPLVRRPQIAAKPPLPPRHPPAPAHHAMHPRPGGLALEMPPAVVEDSYTRLLREKDAELHRVLQVKDGEIANLRHKMRALSSQIEARAAPAPVTPKRSVPAAGALEERARLQKEVSIAQADLSRLSEKLLYAQQEISELQQREQQRAAMAESTAAAAAPQAEQPMSQPERLPSQSQRPPRRAVSVPSVADFPDPGTLGGTQLPCATLAGEVVEPTQVAYEMSRRDPRRPRRRGRRGIAHSSGDPASSTFANAESALSPTQLLSRAILSAEEMPPPSSLQMTALGNQDGSGSKRYRTPEKEAEYEAEQQKPDVQLIFFGKVEDAAAEGELRALRHALFGDGRAERLLHLCTSLGNRELRTAIAAVMANDLDWVMLLKPLSSLGNNGATSVALSAICALVEHNKSCRIALALSPADDRVLTYVLQTLDSATDARDASVASLALRIMSCVVSEICVLEDDSQTDNGIDKPTAAVATRRRLEHDAVLHWLQQRGKEMMPACEAAAEIASELILSIVGTPVAHHDQREGDFLEQAVLCFAATLPILTVSPDVKSRALCSLDWASQVAPYLLDEQDACVMESVCTFVVDLVHQMRLRVMLLQEAQTAFCELLEGDADEAAPQCWSLVRGDSRHDEVFDSVGPEEAQVAAVKRAVRIAQRLVRSRAVGLALVTEVSPSTRNVALGTMAFLGWPDEDPKTQQYPAVNTLHADPSLARDARIVYDALIRSERAS
jgi:hypothetical protein